MANVPPRSAVAKVTQQPTFFTTNTEVVSSLPLQLLLYYNVLFSVIYVGVEVPLFVWKQSVDGLNLAVQDITYPLLCLLLWLLVEPLRLFLGWTGNLREQVPQLGAFLLLCVLPQLAVLLFFLAGTPQMPLELTLNVGQTLFLLPQLVLGFRTMRALMRVQLRHFYLATANADDDFHTL